MIRSPLIPLVVALLTACAGTGGQRIDSGATASATDRRATESGATSEPALLFFENISEAAVTIYLRTATNEIRIGRVDPGRTARLRLEADVREFIGEVRLHIIPAGERANARAQPILSFPTDVGFLASVKWVLRGRNLMAIPL